MKCEVRRINPLPGSPASYRRPMSITHMIIHAGQQGHYLCPRCGISLDREFTAYCDRCGQKLSWKGYQKAKQIHCQGIVSLHL